MTRNLHISKRKVCRLNSSILVPRMFHYEKVFSILNNHINLHAIGLRPNCVGFSRPFHLRTDTDPISARLCFFFISYYTPGKVQKLTSNK